MSALTIAISLVATDMTASAFASLLAGGTNTSSLINKLSSNFKNLSDGMKTTAVTAVAASAAFELFKAPTEYGIQAAADLEQQLVRLKNALQDDTTSMGVLSSAVNDLAIRTVFSSSDASNAFEQLVEMGFNAQQVMYGMDPAAKSLMDGMYHAKEATMGLGNEALVMGQAMKTDAITGAKLLGAAVHVFAQEGLSAKDVADQLAAAFLNGVPSASALLQAFNMAGAGAAASGVKMQDFLVTLDLLTRNGMSASSAGASLNYMFQSLTAPIQKQAKALAELGIMTMGTSQKFDAFKKQLAGVGPAGAAAVKGLDGSVTKLKDLYDAGQNVGLIPLDQSFMGWALSVGALNNKLFDAQGQFVGMKKAIEILDGAMAGMNTEQKMQVLSDLFNVRSGRAAKVLTNMQDFADQYDAIAKQFGKVDVNSMAQKQLETLTGSWEAFQDSFKSLMANIFLPVLPAITSFILKINDLIQVFINMPEPVRKSIGIFLILATAVSGLIALIAGGIVAVSAVVSAAAALGITLGMVGAAVGIVAGVIAAIVALFFSFRDALASNAGLMQFFQGLLGLIAQWAGVLWGQLVNLWNTLKLLEPVWNVLKVILAVIAVVIVGVLLAAVLLIIGVFIAVVFVINLVIQAVVFLLGKLGEFFGWVLGALGGFKDMVVAAFGFVVSWLQNAWNTIIQTISNAIQWIKDTIHSGFQWIQDTIHNAISFVVGLFQWLYDHNYYFQALVDTIRQKFNEAKQFITAVWNGIVGFLTGAWNVIKTVVSTAISVVVGTVGSGFTNAKNTVSSILAAVRTVVSTAWTNIVNTVKTAIGNFLHAIDNATKPARDAIGNVINAIKNAISNVFNQARDWGAHMLQMFIDGIKSKIGELGGVLGNVGGKIASVLGFHSPPAEGPLADSDTYMPNMMGMFSKGITDHMPLLSRALDNVSGLAAAKLTGLSTQVITPSIAANLAYAGSTSSGGGQVVIPVNLDGKQIAEYTLSLATGQLRQAGMTRYVK
jgi:TP901 family phage tail tape measure protein